jgi:hypothetical protein
MLNTKELFEEQDEKENVEARSKIMLLSPIEEVLSRKFYKSGSTAMSAPCGLHCRTILSNQYLLPVTQLVPYTYIHTYIHTHNVAGTELQELIQQNSQHKETFCLLLLTVL